MSNKYQSFEEFWPFYLSQHSHRLNRHMHFIGTSIVIGLLIAATILKKIYPIYLIPFAGYGFAWAGHFFIEKNKPATFQYPWWSLLGDFKMYAYILAGKI